ncbi:uncharacterized protein LOC110933551 [Helianthus annuus]|uniref:uncharacterized protein LOC110933551 n=1 Tax=Helianthus annuus TaxID=4232 RepID=UPI000B9017E9|nr:uncharacterized protein LOC110933551 [Helianthus annuus]
MEALSCMLDKALAAEVIKGVQLPNNGPVITHLLYADDAIILGDWTKDDILNVLRILRCFHICSGLKLNVVKSNLYGIDLAMDEVGNIANDLDCKSDSTPFKYLRVLVGANMNRINNWQTVYEVFQRRLALWKSEC